MAGFAPEVLALLADLGLDVTILKAGVGGVGGIDALAGIGPGVQYHVDNIDGNDANDGESWAKAVQTIARAIALNDATVVWPAPGTPKHMNTIWVKPGVYAEVGLSFPFYCHLIGLGIRGTDTEVKISPATGPCFTGTMLGCHLANLRLEVNEATDILDIGTCNNSLIEHCHFYFTGDWQVTGIDTENCTHLTVRYCDFGDGTGKFFYRCIAHHGGAGIFAHNCRYHDNNMHAYECGIWIEDTCTATQTIIKHNVIQVNVVDALAGIGIDDNQGQTLCIDNWIVADDAIDHPNTATRCIANHIIDTAAGGAVELLATD